jgi:hypothetical protein
MRSNCHALSSTTEVEACATVVAKWLIGIAASRLPNEQRAGVQAEWMSHLNEESTPLRKLLHAVGCLCSASSVAKELVNYPKVTRRPPTTEPKTTSFLGSLIAIRRSQLLRDLFELRLEANKDPKVAAAFAELSAARAILENKDKRRAFDQGYIDAETKLRRDDIMLKKMVAHLDSIVDGDEHGT